MKTVVSSSQAPAAIGPYSQAIKVPCRQLVFCSGQVPLDPTTMTLVGQTAAEQCRQVMENLRHVLAAAGSDFTKVVRSTVYLLDLNDFAAVNEVYGSYFTSEPPARATVQVCRLPKDARIEIDMIAVA